MSSFVDITSFSLCFSEASAMSREHVVHVMSPYDFSVGLVSQYEARKPWIEEMDRLKILALDALEWQEEVWLAIHSFVVFIPYSQSRIYACYKNCRTGVI